MTLLLMAAVVFAGLNVIRIVVWSQLFAQPFDWIGLALNVAVVIGVPIFLWATRGERT